MKKSERKIAAVGAVIVASILVLIAAPGSGPSCPSDAIAGSVFRDYDYDGVQGATEPGESNITVEAYDETGSLVATTFTLDDGSYVFTLPAGSYRIETISIPSFLSPGVHGVDSVTTVYTTTTGTCGVSVALSNPAQYCNANPELVTPVHISGDALLGGDAATVKSLVSFPYTATGSSSSIGYSLPKVLAQQQQTGSLWGVAYQRSSKKIFSAALLKRHTGLGPLSSGGLYVTDYSNPAIPVTSSFVDLKTIGIPTGVDPRQPGDLQPNAADPSEDPNVFRSIGRMAIGDVDISEDEKTLWIMNLNNKTIYSVFINLPAQVPTAANVTAFPIANPGCPDGYYRPWGLKVMDGDVYVGVTCSAEGSQDPNQLHAYVLKLHSGTFTSALDFPLDYTKGYAIIPGLNPLPDPGYLWRPWARSLSDISPAFPGFTFLEYPQPILSGIEFDFRGNIALGFLDRSGISFGPNNLLFGAFAGSYVNAPSGGDLLYACNLGSGTYVLENNGACPGGPTSALGVGNNQGPGGGEFFFADFLSQMAGGSPVDVHQEVALGAITYKPGATEIISNIYDGFEYEDNSTATYSLNDGAKLNAYQIYDVSTPGAFGKAVGVGDIELLCDPAPQEIGNLVWLDADADGSQDANEVGIAGITVSLYDPSNSLIAQTITDTEGKYYFNTADGISASSGYLIKLDNAADFAASGPLDGLTLTTANADQNQRDSDGVLSGGFPSILIATDAAGINNHTFDFGFFTTPICIPSEEICDGIDNDCDGEIDELNCVEGSPSPSLTPSPTPSSSPSPTPTPDCETVSFGAQVKQVDGNSVALYLYAQQMINEVQKSTISKTIIKKSQKILANINSLHVTIWEIANLQLPQTTLICTSTTSCPSYDISASVAKAQNLTNKMYKQLVKMSKFANTKHKKTIVKAAKKVKQNTAATLTAFPTEVTNC